MADEHGRQAYIPEFDPADRIAQAKAAITRARLAAEAPDDLEDPDHAA